MNYPKDHPLWKILAVLVIGGLGLGYSHVVYSNGADPKDSGLIALVAGLTAAATKYLGSHSEG